MNTLAYFATAYVTLRTDAMKINSVQFTRKILKDLLWYRLKLRKIVEPIFD